MSSEADGIKKLGPDGHRKSGAQAQNTNEYAHLIFNTITPSLEDFLNLNIESSRIEVSDGLFATRVSDRNGKHTIVLHDQLEYKNSIDGIVGFPMGVKNINNQIRIHILRLNEQKELVTNWMCLQDFYNFDAMPTRHNTVSDIASTTLQNNNQYNYYLANHRYGAMWNAGVQSFKEFIRDILIGGTAAKYRLRSLFVQGENKAPQIIFIPNNKTLEGRVVNIETFPDFNEILFVIEIDGKRRIYSVRLGDYIPGNINKIIDIYSINKSESHKIILTVEIENGKSKIITLGGNTVDNYSIINTLAK